MDLGAVPESTRSGDSDDINLNSLRSIQKAAELARSESAGGVNNHVDEDEAAEEALDTLQDLNPVRRAPSRSGSAMLKPVISRSQSLRMPRRVEDSAEDEPARGNLGRSSSMRDPQQPGELSRTPSRRGVTRSSSTRAAPSRGLTRSNSSRAPPSRGLTRSNSTRLGGVPRAGSVRGSKRLDGDSGLRPSTHSRNSLASSSGRDFQKVGRNISGISLDSTESGLESCFSRDSISVRKDQWVADPLDIVGSYHDEASFADHDTHYGMSVMSGDDDSYGDITEYLPPGYSDRTDLLLMAQESFGQSGRTFDSSVDLQNCDQSVCSAISNDFEFAFEEPSHTVEDDDSEEEEVEREEEEESESRGEGACE